MMGRNPSLLIDLLQRDPVFRYQTPDRSGNHAWSRKIILWVFEHHSVRV